MEEPNSKIASNLQKYQTTSILEIIPSEVRKWVEALPLKQRQYVLSLCHIMCASPTEIQADFLNDYTADGLVYRMLQDQVPQQVVKKYLKNFHIHKELSNSVLKDYVKQFYIHSAQDLRTQPEFYLESVLRLLQHTKERSNLFNYILGFEILKMMFKMSWLQHERLYRLQKNQDSFLRTYIKPIQYTHRINGVVVPHHETIFFAKRSYFIKRPQLKEKKLIELVMVTFTTETVTNLGFLIIHHLNYLVFDYEYIFAPEPECIFLW